MTIDRAGRIVLPESIRDQLGLEADEELDVVVDDVGIRLQPRRRLRRRIIVDVDGWPVISAASARTIDDTDVRALRDVDQR